MKDKKTSGKIKYSDKSQIDYLENIPKKRVAAIGLIFNKQGQLLILNPNYTSKHLNNKWILPGGVVEKYESPLQAMVREVREELHINIRPDRCITVDYTKRMVGKNYKTEAVNFVFIYPVFTLAQIKKIKPDPSEVLDFKFVTLNQAYKMLVKTSARRLKSLGQNFKQFYYSENGQKLL